MENKSILKEYTEIAGRDVVEHLRQLAKPLRGVRFVHVNSARVGGGVAEILHKIVPLMQELGIDVSWEVISGDSTFYQCTKAFHNAIQGNQVNIPESFLRGYEVTNSETAENLKKVLQDAKSVISLAVNYFTPLKHNNEDKKSGRSCVASLRQQ